MEVARGLEITRLADLTGLDEIGVPVFQAVRPLGWSLSVSQGKGLTPLAAKVSALMEAIEVTVAERLAEPSPGNMPAPSADWCAAWGYPVHMPPSTFAGTDLLSGECVKIPWEMICLDYRRADLGTRAATSMGLASGNDLQEATLAALTDLLENQVCAKNRCGLAWLPVSLETIDAPVVAELLASIGRANLDVQLSYGTLGPELVAFKCRIDPKEGHYASFVPIEGWGCFPERVTAAVRAILEAIQARVTHISGAREDLAPTVFKARRVAARPPCERQVDWADIPTLASPTVAGSIKTLQSALQRAGCGELVRSELPSPDARLSIVKVVARDFDMPAPSARPAPKTIPKRLKPNTAAPWHGKAVLFVGASWPEARSSENVIVRPPAKCGDFVQMIPDFPAAVGLVDGCFEEVASVWHKEILDFLDNDIPVYGAGSMGALRAAELADFGMRGVGRVYNAYREGTIDRDDAVAFSMAEHDSIWRPMSISLVDAEHAIDGVRIDDDDAILLKEIVRSIHYRKRSWNSVAAEFVRRGGRAAWSELGPRLEQARSIKREDAIELFTILDRGLYGQPIPKFDMPRTQFYGNLKRRKFDRP